jgi:hypothetical protein
MSYGVIVFIDLDGDVYPSTGDVFQFYQGKGSDPDEIYLNSDLELNIFLDDTYVWMN